MRKRNTVASVDRERRAERHEARWTRRWGRLERDELETLVAELEDEAARQADDAKAVAAWFDTLTKVAGVLLRGGSIVAETHVVGLLPATEDEPRWACVRAEDGAIVEVYQAFDEGGLDEHGPYASTRWEPDFSAFAAARAFIEAVGVTEALDAIAAREAARQQSRSRARTGAGAIELAAGAE